MNAILRGDIFYCDLGNGLGSEQRFHRPVLILQANELNRKSPTTIIAPITKQIKHPFMRAHCILDDDCILHEPSMVLAEQVRTIDKQRLQSYIGRLKDEEILAVEQALRFCLGLVREPKRITNRRSIWNSKQFSLARKRSPFTWRWRVAL